jgi:hypothetical protein
MLILSDRVIERVPFENRTCPVGSNNIRPVNGPVLFVGVGLVIKLFVGVDQIQRNMWVDNSLQMLHRILQQDLLRLEVMEVMKPEHLLLLIVVHFPLEKLVL